LTRSHDLVHEPRSERVRSGKSFTEQQYRCRPVPTDGSGEMPGRARIGDTPTRGEGSREESVFGRDDQITPLI
jgi:hypothetical protein